MGKKKKKLKKAREAAAATANTVKREVDWGAILARASKATDAIPKSPVRLPADMLAWDAFKPYVPPKEVVPKGWKAPKLAMDSSSISSWNPNAYAVSTLFNQGWTFLGYAALAELSQIPEYRVISETLATESTRKWIEFQAAGDLEQGEAEEKSAKIKKLEEAVQRFRLRDCFAKLALYDGLMGRAHLYIDTGSTDDPAELKTTIGNGHQSISKTKAKNGKLRGFRVVEPIWTYPASYDSNDPLKENWYDPSSWFVMGKEVHVTRLLRFVSREVPDILKPAYAFGGLSLSQMAKPYVDNWLRTRQSVADIVHAFSVMVLMTDLSTSLQADGDQLFRRLELFNKFRDNKGVFLLNKESEDFKNISAPLSTLDMLQAQTQEHMAAVSRIPIVKLLGIQPAGLNASSAGEIRVWEDSVAAYQESVMRTPLETAINFIQLSEFGEVDEGITWRFVPLHTLSETEEADIQLKKAQAHQIYVDIGSIGNHEVRRSLADDPETPYPGLDVDDMPDKSMEPEPGNIRELTRVDETESANLRQTGTES